MNISNNQLQNAREQLPEYVNGSLSAEQQKALEADIALYPELQDDLIGWQQLAADVEATVFIPTQRRGLEKLQAKIAAERSGKIAANESENQPQAHNTSGTKASRVQAWWRPALAIAATVAVVQTGVVTYLLQNPNLSTSNLNALSGPSTHSNTGEILTVTFQPQITELELRKSLIKVHANIISGPSALGVYQIQVSAGQGNSALKALQMDAHVESVTLNH